eukprot:CAMPEP_0184345154 /NCGR_PEP_ID=MMETSP1089-20130417/13595_1 /TAXON_ID=38269 ORGANISM="Gloeochaete wittrockiana, Strain SAG46.84" /NCGR_SAMPLE_ID=MMETSP1089 /ASSEMBLY_ACC=CAM_ASM_000445 /LENGTH=534 /DNA_ID=CAMNT_0026675343 /DNA_START=53 /DNA_END=1657 /DNA_ORIENTATION=+
MSDLWEQFNALPGWKVALGTATTIVLAKTLSSAVSDPAAFKQLVVGSLIKSLRNSVPFVGQMVKGKIDEQVAGLEKQFDIPDVEKFFELPLEGKSREDVLQLLELLSKKEEHHWKGGKVSGVVYGNDPDHTALMVKALETFAVTNPLHPEVFPSIRKFESEIIAMTVNLLAPGVAGVCGAVTSGGSDSILMAVKTHRDYYRTHRGITAPEMIVPESAHAAFSKAAHYFGIKIHKVPVRVPSFDADVAAMTKLINANTIMFVGSAPSYSYGIIDPIEDLAQVAKAHGIGLHVDSCLGGFILPFFQRIEGFAEHIPRFDFTVDGVTSMSADTHKYGYAVKGTSVVMFRTPELRKSMYFVDTEWPGGVYASHGVAGSRPGCLIAACWTSLVSTGFNGYLTKARGIAATQAQIKAAIPRDFTDVELCGDSYSTVLGFKSVNPKELNIFSVMEGMTKRGWSLNAMQKPNSLHLCLTGRHVGKAEEFLADFHDAIAEAKSNPKLSDEGAAPIYGLAYGMPDRSLVDEVIISYLDILLQPL